MTYSSSSWGISKHAQARENAYIHFGNHSPRKLSLPGSSSASSFSMDPSLIPSCHHSWTRLGYLNKAEAHPRPRGSIPSISGGEQWPQTWREADSHLDVWKLPQCMRKLMARRNQHTAVKSRDRTRRFPNQALSSSQLHLEILSRNTTNRFGNKEQPW